MLLDLLDPGERDRAARFRFETDRDAFIASHGWLRMLLGRYLRLDPRSIRFTFGQHKKPFVHGQPLQFNFSHAGAMAACALTREREVGIDIERIRPVRELEAIACRFFHPEVCRNLFALDEEERTSAFFRAWARHEAHIKALGVSTGGQPASGEWSAFDLDTGPNYAGAVAIPGANWTIVSLRE